MAKRWSYEAAIQQAMKAKRMLLISLHEMYKYNIHKISFVGFAIHERVWTNQIAIIPGYVRFIATAMKAFGLVFTIEKCGELMAPLFMDDPMEIREKSGCLLTWKKKN